MKKEKHLKPVLTGTDAERIVFDYHPKEFPVVFSKPAKEFVDKQNHGGSDFMISDLVSEQAGIAEINRRGIEARVEEQALERLKEVEEKAYEEAYKLGLVEGKETAFAEHNSELLERIHKLDDLLARVEDLKKELIDINEIHIVKLIYQIAKRVALKDIAEDPEAIVPVIRRVVDEAQTEETVLMHVSQADFEMIEIIRQRNNENTDFLKRLRLEPSESVAAGGCWLESNFGTIDATLEGRVDKAWKILVEKLPHVINQDQIGADDSVAPNDDSGEEESS